MDSLLIYLLSIILASHSLSEMKPETIPFPRLPIECAAEYDPFLRKERKAVSTDVIRIDLDGDGKPEMLVWTGDGGSAGEEWSVMRHNGTRYARIGRSDGFLRCRHLHSKGCWYAIPAAGIRHHGLSTSSGRGK